MFKSESFGAQAPRAHALASHYLADGAVDVCELGDDSVEFELALCLLVHGLG